ncbi:FecCD family ABC transporter permease [Streptomyces sp. NPDC050560]|uniref:FecCD family ABC transporter permease n=1 Tax=Streptomyces sp. NPDC050560 TaxID=3365630 RepID=UPI0037BDB243
MALLPVAGVLALAALALCSVAVGSRPIAPHTVLDALFHYTGTADQITVRTLRVPRTLTGIAVGAALGTAGALAQAVTRNPMADPGLLGVNAGASAAVVAGMGLLGVAAPGAYVWLALLGAAGATVLVYAIGSRAPGGATPVRLVLAGAAVSAGLLGFVRAVLTQRPGAFDSFRYWQIGSLAGRGTGVLLAVLPFLLAGAVIALCLPRALNALALGDDVARAQGVSAGRTRLLAALAVTLLCGAATAAAGPVSFLGLAVPHLVRRLTGPDQRRVVPYSMLTAPSLLLAADIVGRVAAPPGELEVGLVTAFCGAPVLMLLAARGRGSV